MKKKWMSGTLAVLLAGTTVASMMPAVPVQAAGSDGTGTTYYVDSQGGNDNNDGTSESKAFQTLNKVNELDLEPGDTVLLKKGSRFEDQALVFTKEDSGTAEAPVKVSTYGEGDRPKINTNGHGQWELNYGNPLDNQNHKWKGTVSSSILIEDTEYIEIDGLELTNDRKSDTDTEKDKEYNDAYAMDRTGVAGVAKDNGTVDHIVLNDLYIHDVTGNVYNKHMTNGGIYFIVEKPTDEGTTGIARYNDVQIKNCSLDTVNRWGIAVGYTYQWSKFTTASLSDDVMAKYGSSNVVIENNYLNHVGGDAITTMYLDRPLVQYNVSENAAEQINYKDYSKEQPSLDANGNEVGKQGVGAGRVAAGIWPWKCKNAIFQYNECFSTLNASNGNGDGQPWDADYGDGTNYQYNYSHGNTASTIMFCGWESINNTFRYNISQNEDMGPLDPAGNTGNCQVYNNTFYIKEGINTIWHYSHGNGGPVTIENNIFYFEGSTPATVSNWNINGNKTYSNNLYYNVSSYPNDAAAVKVDAGTDVLVNAGSGPSAAAADKQARSHEDPTASTVFDGYKLAENSPAINAGKVIVDKNGYTIDHDFFGHAITAVPEIGAAESDAVTALVLRSNVYTISGTKVSDLPKNTTVAEFLKNVVVDAGVKVTIKNGETVLGDSDIVKGGATIVLSYEGMEDVIYTVIASSDKELKDSYYEVKGTTMNVPYTDKNPTTVKEMKNNITVADTATVSVINGGTELADTDAVAAGMTLRITAEDGTTNDYTIGQKNTYNWLLDYVNGQQGNVWFGQMKNGTGSWANMTDVDRDGWPNWCVNTYYGPGIDAPQGTVTTTDTTAHGLLSAPPNTSITTAMAYRVPKSGTVSFQVKDDEPYLRQNGNSGGTVTLSLLVNDTVKQSVTLSTSYQKATDWADFDEIEVKQGDVIRVTTKSNSNPTRPSVHVTPIITYVDKAPADTEAPTAPTAVTATDITETTAKITWDAASDNVGVEGYDVYVNDTKVNDELITGTEYDLTGLTEGTEYTVTVTAADAAGNTSDPSEAATFTTLKAKDTEAPSVPAAVTATNITMTTAKITWDAASDNVGVVGYNVYVNEEKVNNELVTETEYDLTGLTKETEYTVTVTAVDAAENESEKTGVVTFTTAADTEAPSVPSDVAVSDITATGATVTWTASTDNVEVAGYNVYVNDMKVNASLVTDTTYTLTGLSEETEYSVTVAAVDTSKNESAKSGAAIFTTLKTEEPEAPAPAAPTTVRSSDVTTTTAKIVWDAASEDAAVVGYNVYVNEIKVNDEPITGTEYDLTGLTEGTDYTVTVTAVNAAGTESARSEAAVFTTLKTEEPKDTEAPTVPANGKATEITYTKATITWDAATDNVKVAGYNVYVNGTKVNAALITDTTYEVTGLVAGTDYEVKITAVDAAGNESEPSEVVTFTTDKEDPVVVDKTKLKETTAKADTALAATDKYTADSLKKLQTVYDQYAGVLNDENATQAQVDEANKAITEALNALEEKKIDDGKKDDIKGDDTKKDDTKKDDTKKDDTKQDDTKKDDTKTNPSDTSKSDNKTTTKPSGTNTGSTATGSTNNTSTGSTKTGTSTTAVKTGDATNVAGWGFALAASVAAAGAAVAGKRKKED